MTPHYLQVLVEVLKWIPSSENWPVGINHGILQVSLDAEDIRNEKVKVLRSMKMIKMDDVVLGQYRGRRTAHSKLPGYLDDKTVPEGRYLIAFSRGAIDLENDSIPKMSKPTELGRELYQTLAI